MYKSDYIITLKHYLILSVIAFAAGILLTVSLSGDALSVTILIISALLISLGISIAANLLRKGSSNKPLKHLLLPFFLLFFIFLGILRIFTAELFSPGALKQHTGTELWLSGTVSSSVSKTSSGYSSYFTFDVTRVNSEDIKPEAIIMYIPTNRGNFLSEGDEICCWTELNIPKRNDEHNNFDYYTHLRGKNIFFIGQTQNANKVNLPDPHYFSFSIKKYGRILKNYITNSVDAMIPESHKFSSILKGILVGDKSGFSNNLYEKFSYAGLSHIVSVSGMHLSILFSIITLVLYSAHTHKKISYFLSIPVVLLLSAVAGFTPSVIRSTIMLLMMIISTIIGKRYTPIDALFLSLGIILAVSPYALFSKSLILSFGATLGILVFFKPLKDLILTPVSLINIRSSFLDASIKYILNILISSIAISFSAFWGTAFSSAFFFGSVSWIQLFSNLWVIPVVTLAFGLGLVGCILYYIFPNLTVSLFHFPLRLCMSIISKTANCFGTPTYAFRFSEETTNPQFFAIYLGAVLVLYLLLKFFSDLKEEKAAVLEEQQL